METGIFLDLVGKQQVHLINLVFRKVWETISGVLSLGCQDLFLPLLQLLLPLGGGLGTLLQLHWGLPDQGFF